MTLNNPEKLFLLVKAQVMHEMLGALQALYKYRLDEDIVNYLIAEERAKIVAINDAQELDDYLHRTKRISLADWLSSLEWKHIMEASH